MLVVLDESLANISPTDNASLAGLESVLTSSYNGEHFLTSSFSLLHALLKLPFGLKSKAALQRLRSNIARHGHLPYPESFVVFITHGDVQKRLSSRRWAIPVTVFRNKSFPASVVLGENMLDAEAYIAGSKQARAKFRLSEVCKTTPDAGGGSQTAVKLEAYLKNTNGFCFCVTDGDYQDPSGTKSAVTKSCEKLAHDATWPAYATDIPARSIENLLPLNLIEDSYGSEPLPAEFHAYKAIHDSDAETTRYIDAKIGLKYCLIARSKPEAAKRTFWSAKVAKHKLQERYDAFSKTPPVCTGDNCSRCVLINGLGGSTLKRVVKYFGITTAQKLAQRVDKTSPWCGLGIDIFHWTLADKPELA